MNIRRPVLVALAIVIALSAGALPTAATQQPSSNFVSRSSTEFVLNGKPSRFGGTNNYYLIYKSNFMVDDLLTTASSNSFQVVRSWGFLDIGNQDGSNSVDGPKEGVYFHYWDGASPSYNDGPTGLQKLDYVIYRAAQLELKLIVPFTNNWRDFGGMDQYVRWRNGQYHDQFYSDPTIKQWYKNYISHLLDRVNYYTGIAYRDDPTIFGWELANEPRCQGSGTYPSSPGCNATLITNWVSEMTAFVQSQDTNHLVGVGDEGFYCNEGASDWTENCYTGVDSIALAALATVDYMSFHLYPDQWGKTTEWGTTWITRHITDGHAAGKPVLLGEFGLRDQLIRNAVYQAWTRAVLSNGGNGDLFWMLAAHQDNGTLYPDYDGYTIYCPSDFCATLRDHAQQMLTSTSVGGVAELPEAAGARLEADGSSWPGASVVAGIAAGVAAGAVVLGGAAWRVRRRWSR